MEPRFYTVQEYIFEEDEEVSDTEVKETPEHVGPWKTGAEQTHVCGKGNRWRRGKDSSKDDETAAFKALVWLRGNSDNVNIELEALKKSCKDLRL